MANTIDIRQLKGKIEPDQKYISIELDGKKQRVMLAYQKTGYGNKRYFMCPRCSKRVEFLYLVNNYWSCRKCSGVNPYHGIQNKTKGGYDEIAYRMKKYGKSHNIQVSFPFSYLEFANDDRVINDKFRNDLKILQALESMRFQALFFGTKFKPKEFQCVIRGKHPLIHRTTLDDMKNNIYDWHSGTEIYIDEALLHNITR